MNRNWKRPQLFHRNMSAGSWWGRTASPCSSAATSSSSAANAWLAAPPAAGPHSSWPRRRPQPIGGRRQTTKVWNWSKRDDQILRYNSFLLPDKHTFRFVVPKKLIHFLRWNKLEPGLYHQYGHKQEVLLCLWPHCSSTTVELYL